MSYSISAAEQEQLDTEGWVVVPDVLSVAEIEVYRARLLDLAEAERADGSGRMHSDDHGQHVRWLMNKGREFEKLVAHPRVVPYFEHLLGQDYTLSTLTSNLIYPGAADAPFHVDPSFPVFVNTLWLLDDFTPENGGTRFVPGSHRWLKKPPRAEDPLALCHPGEIRLNAPKGSVFLFNGATWHATGANQTEESRICLIGFCCRSFMKPMFDFVHFVEPEVVARATPEMRRIYGFDSRPQGPDRAPDADA